MQTPTLPVIFIPDWSLPRQEKFLLNFPCDIILFVCLTKPPAGKIPFFRIICFAHLISKQQLARQTCINIEFLFEADKKVYIIRKILLDGKMADVVQISLILSLNNRVYDDFGPLKRKVFAAFRIEEEMSGDK